MDPKWCKLTADFFPIAWKTDLIIMLLWFLLSNTMTFLWKENKLYSFQSQHPQLDFAILSKVTWDTFPT